MTLTIARRPGWAGASGLSWGLSPDAKDVRRMEADAVDLEGSIALGRPKRELYEALATAAQEASVYNWDGEGAAPADPAAFVHAIRFIGFLPTTWPPPEVMVNKEGNIGLDWDYGPNRILSLRISRDGTIYFASLRGNQKNYGSVALLDGIPRTVVQRIEDVIRAAEY